MIKIGITGQAGFVGTHLYNTLGLFPEEFQRIDFRKDYFADENKLFLKQVNSLVCSEAFWQMCPLLMECEGTL